MDTHHTHILTNNRPCWLMGLCLSLLSLCGAVSTAQAQDMCINCPDSAYCVPGVVGLPRSKGIVAERVSTLKHGITSWQDGDQTINQATIQKNRTYRFKLRGPIVNKPSYKIVLGVKASFEEYEFMDPMSLNDPLLISLEDRPLRTFGIDLYTVKSFKGNNYMVTRVQSRVNGDFDRKGNQLGDYLRFNAVSVYGWKLDERRVFGLGAAFSHIYGTARILPVVVYYNSFHPYWGLEANLPANARLRYSKHPSRYIYLGAEIQGAKYRLDPTDISAPFFLEKSQVDIGVEFEQEIHDWLWVGLKTGFRQNLSLDVTESDALSLNQAEPILQTDVANSMYFGFSIFMVTPKKMLQK